MKNDNRGKKPYRRDSSSGDSRSSSRRPAQNDRRQDSPRGRQDGPRSDRRDDSRGERSYGRDSRDSRGRGDQGRFRKDDGDRRNSYRKDGDSPRGGRSYDRPGSSRPGNRPSRFRKDGDEGRSSYRKSGSDRSSYGKDRGDRSSYGKDRGERSSYGKDRGERSSYGKDRDDRRGPRNFRDDRGGRGREEDRGRDSRKSFGPRDGKDGGRNFRGDRRDDRGGRGRDGDRDTRKSFGARPSRGEDRNRRDDRGGRGREQDRSRDTRKSFGPRDGKGRAPKRPDYDTPQMREVARKKGDEETKKKETRLNKFIANAGICSRREADEHIAQGDVQVNGKVVKEMGFKVQPGDTVKYKGEELSGEAPVYILLNKPKDYITTTKDPQERKTVMELVGSAAHERIFPVGRLDRATTGLLLFTNDGDLAEKLTHPSHKVQKLYEVTLDRPITPPDFLKLEQGLELEDGLAKPVDVAIVGGGDDRVLGLEIHMGRNRIVRRMMEALGYRVEKLDRVMYAGLTKKDLSRGQWRYLKEKEVVKLKYFL